MALMLSAPGFGQLREPMTVVSHLQEVGTHCQSLPLKNMVAQRQRGMILMNSLQTFSLFTFMARSDLHVYLKNTVIYLCIKESIAPF